MQLILHLVEVFLEQDARPDEPVMDFSGGPYWVGAQPWSCHGLQVYFICGVSCRLTASILSLDDAIQYEHRPVPAVRGLHDVGARKIGAVDLCRVLDQCVCFSGPEPWAHEVLYSIFVYQQRVVHQGVRILTAPLYLFAERPAVPVRWHCGHQLAQE